MKKGGKRAQMSCLVVVGNQQGVIGIGLGKGPDSGKAQKQVWQKNRL